MLREHGVNDDPRRRVRGGPRRALVEASTGAVAGGSRVLARHVPRAGSDRAAAARRATRRCRRRASAEPSGTPRRAAAASTAAAIARSSRSTTAASASCRSTSCWRTSRRRSTQAPATSRSAIPISSTASATPSAVLERLRAAVSRRVLRRHDQGRASAATRRRAAAASRHRLRVRDERGRVASRTTCWRRSRRGTRAPTSSRSCELFQRGRLDAGADVRRVHAVDDDRQLLRAAAGARSAGSGRPRRADSARDPTARHRGIAVAGAGRRARLRSAVRRRVADLPWVHPRSARRSPAEARSSGSSASDVSARGATLFAAIWRLAHEIARTHSARARSRRCRSRATIPYLNEPWYC